MSYQRAGPRTSCESGNWLQLVNRMTRLSQLTLRNFLIAAHDVLATAFALLASFYLRFEGGEGF